MEVSKVYLKKEDMAKKYQVSKRTINNWMRYEGMPHVTVNRQVVRFDVALVDDWYEKRNQQKLLELAKKR